MVFRHNFIHPKWFATEHELSKLPIAQQQNLKRYLGNFLEIGKFIRLSKEIRALCKKFNCKPGQVHVDDVKKIRSWPSLLITLVELAEGSS